MIGEADVVVVGAGAFGASTAYHLARRGKRVALVDSHALVSQTSPRAAGLTLQVRSNAVMTEVARRSIAKIVGFTRETGQPLVFHQSGSMKLARNAYHAQQVRQEVEDGKRWGLEIDFVSADEARRLAPFLQPEGAQVLWYTPSDLYLEPRDLPLAYARAAEVLGATLLPETAVTAIGARSGAVNRVVTERGEILTPVVVDTAGAWTRVVAEMTGVRVPIVPTRHQLLITQPIDGIASTQPIVRVLDNNVYVRPERGGLMLGGYEPDPLLVDPRTLPPSFQIADLALDLAPLRRLADDVRDFFPVFQAAEVAEFRGGLPTMTPDGRFVLDRVPGVEGFFVASGCCVGGLSTSPAVGELMAAWVDDGVPPMDMSYFSLARFGAELASEERLREACLWRYAHHYADETAAGRGGT